MGKFAFLFLALCFLVSPSVGLAEDYDPSVEGCKFFCRAKYPLVEGGRDTGYDNCIVQTQAAGKCGGGSSSSPSAKKSTELPQTGPIPTSRPETASSCKTDFDKYYNACQATTGEAESTCDEDNNQELKDTMSKAQSGNGGQGSVQQACGQSSNLSESAKNAMTTYKNNCSGALTSCRSACADFAIFMTDNKCWSELGYNEQSSKTVVDSLMKTCENQQAKVTDAEKAIANYSNTNAGAQACQAGTSGMSMPQQSKAEANAEEAKTFCQMNPNTPGCSNATVANCSDPSQASNKVCVCSQNPRDPICSGSQSSEFSSNSPSIDSSSRVPTNESNPGGDIPGLPDMTHAKVNPSGDSQGIDGRQNTAALGGGGGGSGSPLGSSGGARGGGNGDEPITGGGTYGGGGGFGAGSGGSSGGGASYGRATGSGSSEGAKAGGPDLRQFLPGGAHDPRYKLQGSANNLEKDGVTGPHSSNWRKIQNRYQILKTTLEP